MDLTVARMTARSLLGRRSALLLLGPALLLVPLAALVRGLAGPADAAVLVDELVGALGLGVVVPLLALVVGTGVIAPEVDDGTIVYVLAKPVRRSAIALAKWGVATAVVGLAGAPAVLVAGWLLTGSPAGAPAGYAVAALLAGAAYAALFLLLGVASRNAVVVGLVYVVLWESVVGTLVSGAQALSVQQWALALGDVAAGGGGAVPSAVGTTTALLLPALVVVALVGAVQRLRGYSVREV